MTAGSAKGPETHIEALDVAIKNHADYIYIQGSSREHAKALRLQALAVRELINNASGEVKDAVIGRIPDIQPILELVFGEDIKPDQIGENADYVPTLFRGIYGRARVVTRPKTDGRNIALDLAAEDSLK